MLQTVIILIGKYQLKDDVLFVVNQRVFYTKTTTSIYVLVINVILFENQEVKQS